MELKDQMELALETEPQSPMELKVLTEPQMELMEVSPPPSRSTAVTTTKRELDTNSQFAIRALVPLSSLKELVDREMSSGPANNQPLSWAPSGLISETWSTTTAMPDKTKLPTPLVMLHLLMLALPGNLSTSHGPNGEMTL